MTKKLKDFDEQYLRQILYNIETQNMTEKEKLIYLRKVVKYLNYKIKYYKDIGIDASIGMLFIGAGIGNGLDDTESIYLSIILCTMGVGSMLLSTVKRNIKHRNSIENLEETFKIKEKKI